MSWTTDPVREAAWAACTEMRDRPPITTTRAGGADQIGRDAAALAERLDAVLVAGPTPLLARTVTQALEQLAPVRALAEQFEQWRQQLPTTHAVGRIADQWPANAELAAAFHACTPALLAAYQALDAAARTAPETGWTTLSTQALHHGPRLTLHRDQILRPDGQHDIYEHIDVRDGVRVVALNDRSEVALVEDAFYLHGRLVHLPGGGIERGEVVEAAAGRELEEETGWRATACRVIAQIHPLPSSTRARTHLVLATGLEPGELRRDPTEAGMTAHWAPLEQALAMVEHGVIREAGSVAALLHTARLLDKEQNPQPRTA
ncbi:NUDIX hydrolase [Kitasatospora sp. NPDC048545]|uniref:NUDIX hydrolase n=1 Tax=Kitasatospora sp. NPDC048545 TaxID=3157208 RepID=UPI0033D72703